MTRVMFCRDLLSRMCVASGNNFECVASKYTWSEMSSV